MKIARDRKNCYRWQSTTGCYDLCHVGISVTDRALSAGCRQRKGRRSTRSRGGCELDRWRCRWWCPCRVLSAESHDVQLDRVRRRQTSQSRVEIDDVERVRRRLPAVGDDDDDVRSVIAVAACRREDVARQHHHRVLEFGTGTELRKTERVLDILDRVVGVEGEAELRLNAVRDGADLSSTRPDWETEDRLPDEWQDVLEDGRVEVVWLLDDQRDVHSLGTICNWRPNFNVELNFSTDEICRYLCIAIFHNVACKSFICVTKNQRIHEARYENHDNIRS